MSSRELEAVAEQEQAAALASVLGISADDLDELDWELDPVESDEGLLYGYNVNFAKESNPEILAKISGLNDGYWIRIGPDL